MPLRRRLQVGGVEGEGEGLLIKLKINTIQDGLLEVRDEHGTVVRKVWITAGEKEPDPLAAYAPALLEMVRRLYANPHSNTALRDAQELLLRIDGASKEKE